MKTLKADLILQIQNIRFIIELIAKLTGQKQGNCMINLLKRKTGSASREDQA
jgi:hypothetical protein